MQASHFPGSQLQTTLKEGTGQSAITALVPLHLGVHAAERTLCLVLRDAPCHLAHGIVKLLTWRQLLSRLYMTSCHLLTM